MLLKHRSLVVLLFCGFLTTLILPCVSNAQVITTAPVTIISPSTVVQSLRKGGYIIYFRHPQTQAEQADTDTFGIKLLSFIRKVKS